jgi:hypothetical protein
MTGVLAGTRVGWTLGSAGGGVALSAAGEVVGAAGEVVAPGPAAEQAATASRVVRRATRTAVGVGWWRGRVVACRLIIGGASW